LATAGVELPVPGGYSLKPAYVRLIVPPSRGWWDAPTARPNMGERERGFEESNSGHIRKALENAGRKSRAQANSTMAVAASSPEEAPAAYDELYASALECTCLCISVGSGDLLNPQYAIRRTEGTLVHDAHELSGSALQSPTAGAARAVDSGTGSR
jgi:hypothetical protein